jgi:signal transduction histidine kinase/CheY-like chemotaxis protein/CHASE3 domain sensor protein
MMANKRFVFGFSIAILLVLIVGGFSLYTLKRQSDQHVWVEHTYKVLEQATYVEKLMVDMETGRRGFRCTGDKTFLEPYYKSQPKLEGAVADLRGIVIDNPQQVQNIDKLHIDVAEVDALWKSINIDVIYRDNDARRTVTLAEKRSMDKVRKDVETIRAGEKELLTQRDRDSQKGIRLAIRTLIIGTILILVIVFTMINAIISENKNRTKAELALQERLDELKKVNAITEETNWILTGMRSINGSLIGNDSLKELVRVSLQAIVDYMEAPAAAFYFFDKQKQILELQGAIGLPGNATQQFKLNEGIVGVAAMKKEVSVYRDIPADYWKISSASGAMAPGSLICVPIWKKDQLQGIIEIAILSGESKRYVDLLNSITDNMAVGVAGAFANDRTNILLAKVQEQKEELESQQEELRQTNEELTHQAEVLRASEEELRTQEEELRQTNEELEVRTEAVELARKSLQKKAKELEISSKYKSEFLANMSHELRTPLNSVLILANLLKENKTNNLSTKQTEYAGIIHKSGTDLLNLINDILDLSKIEAGKIDIAIEPVKIADIAFDMEQLFTVLAAEKKIAFAIDQPYGNTAILNTDRQRIEQVVKNLLSNAFKFTREHGKVTLSFDVLGDNLSIAVTDTGIGIPADKQQLIFKAFQQADGSTSRRFGGTGLGLSISKELVSRLGGELKVSSVVGEGSVFSVLLPVNAINLQKGLVVPASAGTKNQLPDLSLVKEQTKIIDDKADIRSGEQFILIIEDDILFAGLVRDFAHSKGYKTILALSGDEGLYYARKYKPSAIILDLGLPVVSGRSFIKLLKTDASLRHIPVHVITAEDRPDGGFADVETFVTKPLLLNELDETFAKIGNYIHQNYKNILILLPNSPDLRKMFDTVAAEMKPGVVYDMVDSTEHAMLVLKAREIDCIILDISQDITVGIATLKALKSAAKEGAYMITCLDAEITPADEKQLKTYSDSIIRRSPQATSRLLDEVALFLYKIQGSISKPDVPARYEQEMDKSLEGRKALLADDDMRNVFAITAFLVEQGIEVITAENGKVALEMLEEHSGIDIVLMDIMMPEMDGYEAMRQIRANKKIAKLPIIALTAKAMIGDREKCIEAGASDYITKPIDSNKLFSLMRVWLSA